MKKLFFLFLMTTFVFACQQDDQDFNPDDLSVAAKRNTNAAVFPRTIPLPNGFKPEGITIGNGTDFYAGSLANGAIVKGNLRTGAIEELVAGAPGNLAVGMDFDPRSKSLFVAGGGTGNAYVYNADNGALIGTYQFGGGFINDVIVTSDGAYFTDSFTSNLYRIPLGPRGGLPDPTEVNTIALGGDFLFIVGNFNANGIVASANGKKLIIVNSAAGGLYQVNPQTGIGTSIDLNGATVSSGDGLVLKGRDLYVVQNFFNQVAVINLSPDWSSGTLSELITDDRFRIPTTADIFGNTLYAVNARFDVSPPDVPSPNVEYEVVGVALP